MKSAAKLMPLLLIVMLLVLSACDWLFLNDDEDPTIQITSPTNYFSYVTTETTLDLAGTAVDNEGIKSVKVTVNGGGAVTADGTSNWSVDNLPLDMGENTVVCEVKDKAGNTASATVYVTRNTDVEFTGVPYFSQGNYFANQSMGSIVRQAISASAKNITAVKLYKVDPADWSLEAEIGNLVDNGDLYQYDEILGDGVYSGYLNIMEAEPGTAYYRVVAFSGSKAENYSPLYKINVFEEITADEVSGIVDNHSSIQAVLNQSTADNLDEAADVLQDWFMDQPGVASAAIKDGYLEITYTNGIKGGVIFSETDENGLITTLGGGLTHQRSLKPSIPLNQQTRGVNSFAGMRPNLAWNPAKEDDPHAVLDKDVLIWQPYQAALAYSYGQELDDIFNVDSDLDLNLQYMYNAECTINSLTHLTEYGTVIFMTHGVGGEHILTHETMNSDNIWDYLGAILNDEIGYFENVTYNNVGGFAQTGTVYSVRSAWISNLGGTFPNSIIYNGSCEGSKTDNLRSAFSGKGAKAYLAFSKIVTARFAKERCLDYFENMAVWLDDNSEAFSGGTDPYRNPAATFTMWGDDELHYSYDLINGDFEFGNINGWTRAGDGRVITQLAGIMPTQGSYMGIISTGLGFTESSGSIAQSFLVPEAINTLSLKWNFMSEEFMEWVGSQYQDYLTFALRDEAGSEQVLFHETIDSFVGYGLEDVSPPIYFDHGDAYGTGWRDFSADISAYHGQVVRLIIRIGDVGDSAYDSACLLDEISID